MIMPNPPDLPMGGFDKPSVPFTGVNLPNTPPLVGKDQPTVEERKRQEEQWSKLAVAEAKIAEFILFVNTHPEAVEWANASIAKTLRVHNR